jgi:hypothetical protein
VPSTTLRVTFGTQSAASQKADAVPAGMIGAAINPLTKTGTAIRLLKSAPRISGWISLGTKTVEPPVPATQGLSASAVVDDHPQSAS